MTTVASQEKPWIIYEPRGSQSVKELSVTIVVNPMLYLFPEPLVDYQRPALCDKQKNTLECKYFI